MRKAIVRIVASLVAISCLPFCFQVAAQTSSPPPALPTFSGNEITRSIAQLQYIMGCLNAIEDQVEDVYKPRHFLFKKRTQQVIDSINKRGIGPMGTTQAYLEMIDKFTYTSAFWEKNATPALQSTIQAALAVVKQIEEEKEFGKYQITRVANTFVEITQLLNDLVDETKSPLLNQTVNELRPHLALAIAKGQLGDRPEAFDSGTLAYDRLKSLYPLFNSLANSKAAFGLVLNIQALVDYYGDFAQRKN